MKKKQNVEIKGTLERKQVKVVKPKAGRVYTFDDWLNNALIMDYEHDPPLINQDGSKNYGRMLLNDSETYYSLIHPYDLDQKRMTFETINKILDCQVEAYEKIVMNEFNERVSYFNNKVAQLRERFGSESAIMKYRDSVMDEIKKTEETYPRHYEAIKTMRTFRNMPYGAKFITSAQYQNPEMVIPSLAIRTPNKVTNEKMVMVSWRGALAVAPVSEAATHISIDPRRMCEGEMEYAFMDGITKFKYWLERLDSSLDADKAIFQKIQRREPINQVPAVSATSAALGDIEAGQGDIDLFSIAMIYHYNDELITPDNKSQIAAQYNWHSTHSGTKLYQHFNKASIKRNRIGNNKSARTTRLRQLTTEVLPRLKGKAAKACKSDIQEAKQPINRDSEI